MEGSSEAAKPRTNFGGMSSKHDTYFWTEKNQRVKTMVIRKPFHPN